MLDSQGSRPDFRCGQGVKHENLLGQDLNRGRGLKYRRLCSVPPLELTPLEFHLGKIHPLQMHLTTLIHPSTAYLSIDVCIPKVSQEWIDWV